MNTCATCRHFFTGGMNVGIGRCILIVVRSSSLPIETYLDELEENKIALFQDRGHMGASRVWVHETFGCVMHERK